MGAASGIAERLLALEASVAALQAEVRTLVGAGEPAPAPVPTALEQMAQQLGPKRSDARLAAALVRAGYTSVEAVAAAPDAALLAVDGVGDKALKAIREKLG